MIGKDIPLSFIAFCLLIATLTVCPATALGQTTTSTIPTVATPTMMSDRDSRETREELRELLHKLPPEVGRVLKLDPTLWKNDAYMANYPALAAFVAQHPEVTNSPGYFLESVWMPTDTPPETPSTRMWENLLAGIGAVTFFFGISGLLMWLLRTVIEHRRWSRLSRVQAEVHNKILDRFASNEDLLKYIETSAGKRFLEAAPIPIDTGARTLSPPVSRILWSVQVGVVLAAAGIGFIFISGNVAKDVVEPFFAMGALALAIGGGFVLSAVISFAISRRLGLWAAPPPLEDAEARATSGD
ncbi:MAG TPA: hypothetical protein VIL97_03185 [Thermoanaerobaculia bacterium]